MIGSILDTVLDRTVAAGYTNVGYRLRSRGWAPDQLGSMQGRTVLVTGATSGLGQAAAEGFARLGATVWLVARDEARGEQTRASVAAAGGDARLAMCDLADLSSVRRLAERFAGEASRLDVLVNNAGVLPARRTLSADAIELTFAVNVVAPFLLTQLMVKMLERGAPAQVINVSSGGMYSQRLRADDLQLQQGEFDGTIAYARSKRAEVILTEMWAQRLHGTGVAVHAMHPGWADTPGVQSSLPRFYKFTRPLLRTPQQGADTIVWLGAAAGAAGSSGGFWHDRRRRPTHLLPRTRETEAERELLWRECERLSGGGTSG
jgi:dehydrogenase/reductase SDR family protein 12